jgi:hypothetical protein
MGVGKKTECKDDVIVIFLLNFSFMTRCFYFRHYSALFVDHAKKKFLKSKRHKGAKFSPTYED